MEPATVLLLFLSKGGSLQSRRELPSMTEPVTSTKLADKRTHMNAKNGILTIFAILIIGSAARSKAGPDEGIMVSQRTGPAVGTIIVYRPRYDLGFAITNWRFNLNHGPDLIVRNGTYYRLTVLAGDSIISHDNMPFLEEDPQTVNVRPGQTVYFQYTIGFGFIFEEADDQESAAITASKLIPLN